MTTLGIIGGGQLAQMCALAAVPLGVRIKILERATEFPARHLASAVLHGDWDDGAHVWALAQQCDFVTLENEFVDAAALRYAEERGAIVRPGSATMATVQDKYLQKTAFAQAGLPVPAFAAVASPAEVVAFANQHGWPVVLKKRRNGYDGKGNATVRSSNELDTAWTKLGASGLYVEAFCPFERELAIVRSQVPQASAALTEQLTRFVSRLRGQPFANAFQRSPGIAESVEWAKALVALDTVTLDPEVVQDTAGILFKQREDVAALGPLVDQLLQPDAPPA